MLGLNTKIGTPANHKDPKKTKNSTPQSQQPHFFQVLESQKLLAPIQTTREGQKMTWIVKTARETTILDDADSPICKCWQPET